MATPGKVSQPEQPVAPRMLQSAPDAPRRMASYSAGPGTRYPAEMDPCGNSATPVDLLPPAVLDDIDLAKRSHLQKQNTHQLQSSPHSQPNTRLSGNVQPLQQQFHRKSIGDWDFVRTIGAGSMGKVKLARHTKTGEKCAVKIVPRASKLYQRAHANNPPISAEEAAQRQKEFDREISRDKRSIREGALGRLLFHPHICRLYEIVPMTNHYYMLFEYVEGGQLLDYIVSHGSLSELYARKLARQIASALDYCHKNNVVHRDLKIENIMINHKGEIKIIDFGLSNLYMPQKLLKTYCGSLYFAAPELLSAEPYVGPEVDVWSFGVVLYVLVCGKVPFDDPVVSALHEKIKKGHVEYPQFLSKDSISLLSRMLVVDPDKRALLTEVLEHPWMNQGYEHPTTSYIPDRAPISLPLDPQIVHTISKLDLGTVSFVNDELTKVLTSPDYSLACGNWHKYAQRGQRPPPGINVVYGFHPLVSIYYLVEEVQKRKRAKEEALKKQIQEQTPCRVDLAAPFVSVPVSSSMRLSTPRSPPEEFIAAHERKNTTPLPVPTQEPQRAHSICNIYTRDQAGPIADVLTSTPRQPHDLERTPQRTPQPISQIPYPEPVHTPTVPRSLNKNSGPADFDSSFVPVSSQAVQNVPDTLDPNGNKPLGINSLLRKFSAKKFRSPVVKVSSPTKQQPGVFPSLENRSPTSGELSPSSVAAADPLFRRGVSMKITAKEKSSGSKLNLQNEQMPKQRPTNQIKEDFTFKTHVNPALASGKSHNFIPVEYLPPLPNIDPRQMKAGVQYSPSKATELTRLYAPKKFHPTARAKSVGSHAYKESLQGKVVGRVNQYLPDAMAKQNSDEGVDVHGAGTEVLRFENVALSEHPSRLPMMSDKSIIEQFNHAKRNSMPSIEYPKTLFLKGFFSVQTTSTKPLPVIRYNILRVLSKLEVRFQEVKGGFMCVHSVYTPTKQLGTEPNDSYANDIIDDYRLDQATDDNKEDAHDFKLSSDSSTDSPDFERRSKQDAHTANSHHTSENSKPSLQVVTSPSGGFVKSRRTSNPTSSTSHRRKFSVGQAFLQNYRKKNGSQTAMPPHTPATARLTKTLLGAMDLNDEDMDEETRMLLQQLAGDDSVDSLSGIMIEGGSDMLVSSHIEQRAKLHKVNVGSDDDGQARKKTPLKFEINIVKVPLVGLYGVQFKKTLGNTWSYKTLAGQILKELNL